MFALVTLLFLLAFTVFNLGKSMSGRYPQLDKATSWVEEHLDLIALWGVVYCGVMVLLTFVFNRGPVDIVVRLIANLAVLVMALPYAIDKVMDALTKTFSNPVITDEVKGWARWSIGREKIVGIAGAVVSVLLLAVVLPFLF